jgi:hypothetical protein
MQNRMQTLTNKLNEARMKPTADGPNEQLCKDLLETTHDAQHSGEEIRGLRT